MSSSVGVGELVVGVSALSSRSGGVQRYGIALVDRAHGTSLRTPPCSGVPAVTLTHGSATSANTFHFPSLPTLESSALHQPTCRWRTTVFSAPAVDRGVCSMLPYSPGSRAGVDSATRHVRLQSTLCLDVSGNSDRQRFCLPSMEWSSRQTPEKVSWLWKSGVRPAESVHRH